MEQQLNREKIINVLKNINATNDQYVTDQENNIKQFSNSQSPVATLVMCCDSRAHTTSFTYSPENNFFLVRNIGNQYILNQGCVEFGVRALKTPILIFLGHTQCGAIKASMSHYDHLPSSIIREIDHLALSIKKTELCGTEQKQWLDAVIHNVNQQVHLAQKDFSDLVENDGLIIVGMILDIDNSLQEGHGRISVINLNGNTNIEEIKTNSLISDFFN